jgi:hypothetical protein
MEVHQTESFFFHFGVGILVFVTKDMVGWYLLYCRAADRIDTILGITIIWIY